MAVLTTKQRNRLPRSQFAIPETRSYPINDRTHGEKAKQMVAKYGTPAEKARVAAAVAKKYPNMGGKG